MSDNVTGIHTSVEIARLLALYQQIAPHRVPLLQACYWRIIVTAQVGRSVATGIDSMRQGMSQASGDFAAESAN